jgi:hypothetical protein
VDFRQRLYATLRALRPVYGEGVMIIGSEVPNLLQPETAVPLVVSKDVDIGVEVSAHARVKAAVASLSELRPSADEPSVLVSDGGLLEVNFVGIDRKLADLTESYVLEDPELPLLVFGTLNLLKPGPSIDLGGWTARLPELPGLLVEKLLTERGHVKGERDMLVALALLVAASPRELDEARRTCASLDPPDRHQVRANLALLALLPPMPEMPDPGPHRAVVSRFLAALEEGCDDI